MAQHYFCSRCGIYTHHRRRSNPNQYGVNVACLKGVSPFDFADVPVIDGVNHPSDLSRSYEVVGYLSFIRAEDRRSSAELLRVTQSVSAPAQLMSTRPSQPKMVRRTDHPISSTILPITSPRSLNSCAKAMLRNGKRRPTVWISRLLWRSVDEKKSKSDGVAH